MSVPKSTKTNTPGVGGETRITDTALKVFDPVPVGVAVTRGPDHRLVYVNAAQRAMFGPRPLDKPFPLAFHDLAESGYALLLDRVMATGEPTFLPDAPVTVDFPEGRRERYFNISFSPVVLEDGEPAVLSMMLDVTDRIDAEQRERAFQRYASLVRTGVVVEWTASPVDGSIQWSHGWEGITGQSPEEYLGYGWLDAVAPEDRPALVLVWSQAIDQVPDSLEHTFRVRVRDGTYRHFRARAVPVRKDGKVVEWMGTCADVEQQWREQRRLDLFRRASEAIAHTTRVEDMLEALTHVIVPELADACAVHLTAETEPRSVRSPFIVERIALTLREGLSHPTQPRGTRFAVHGAFLQAIQHHPIHEVFPAGKPPTDSLSPESVRWLSEVGANSVVVLPLTSEGKLIASLSVVVCGEREPLNQDDVDLLADLLDHIRSTLDTFAELQRTQRAALALQHSLLSEPPTIPGVPIVGRYRSSPTSAEVGGDWYDAFTVDGAVMLAIGDIAGHDLAAAIAMSQLRNMLRAFAVDRPQDPQEVLRRLDNAVARSGEYQGTATSVLARIAPDDAGRWWVDYSVAGHLPPLLVLPDGDTRFLEEAHDLLLGLDPGAPRSSAVEPLPPGATLLLYTDGLVEHASEPLDTGLDRLARHCAAMADTPLDRFCDRLLTELPVAGNDDITLIALRPAASPPDLPSVRRSLSAQGNSSWPPLPTQPDE